MPIGSGAEGAAGIGRADVLGAGLDHGGPSYELRIFLGNPGADEDTPLAPEHGYAGSIHVYGSGGVAGVPAPMPGARSVIATEAVRAAAAKGPRTSVTLVPVGYDAGELELDLDRVGVSLAVSDA